MKKLLTMVLMGMFCVAHPAAGGGDQELDQAIKLSLEKAEHAARERADLEEAIRLSRQQRAFEIAGQYRKEAGDAYEVFLSSEKEQNLPAPAPAAAAEPARKVVASSGSIFQGQEKSYELHGSLKDIFKKLDFGKLERPAYYPVLTQGVKPRFEALCNILALIGRGGVLNAQSVSAIFTQDVLGANFSSSDTNQIAGFLWNQLCLKDFEAKKIIVMFAYLPSIFGLVERSYRLSFDEQHLVDHGEFDTIFKEVEPGTLAPAVPVTAPAAPAPAALAAPAPAAPAAAAEPARPVVSRASKRFTIEGEDGLFQLLPKRCGLIRKNLNFLILQQLAKVSVRKEVQPRLQALVAFFDSVLRGNSLDRATVRLILAGAAEENGFLQSDLKNIKDFLITQDIQEQDAQEIMLVAFPFLSKNNPKVLQTSRQFEYEKRFAISFSTSVFTVFQKIKNVDEEVAGKVSGQPVTAPAAAAALAAPVVPAPAVAPTPAAAAALAVAPAARPKVLEQFEQYIPAGAQDAFALFVLTGQLPFNRLEQEETQGLVTKYKEKGDHNFHLLLVIFIDRKGAVTFDLIANPFTKPLFSTAREKYGYLFPESPEAKSVVPAPARPLPAAPAAVARPMVPAPAAAAGAAAARSMGQAAGEVLLHDTKGRIWRLDHVIKELIMNITESQMSALRALNLPLVTIKGLTQGGTTTFLPNKRRDGLLMFIECVKRKGVIGAEEFKEIIALSRVEDDVTQIGHGGFSQDSINLINGIMQSKLILLSYGDMCAKDEGFSRSAFTRQRHYEEELAREIKYKCWIQA